jgi:hypothetical protein
MADVSCRRAVGVDPGIDVAAGEVHTKEGFGPFGRVKTGGGDVGAEVEIVAFFVQIPYSLG